MKKIALDGIGIACATLVFAPVADADQPAAGDQYMKWHATTTDNNGNAMTCTHTADSGHLMYWEIGGAQDTAWVVTR